MRVARQLRLVGHSVFLPIELGADGWEDEAQLEEAHKRHALLVTANIRHFRPLHDEWHRLGRAHSGILQSPQEVDSSWWITRLGRAASVLHPSLTASQLLDIHLFASEESALAYADSLRQAP